METGEVYATVDARTAENLGIPLSGDTPIYDDESPVNFYILWQYSNGGISGLTGRGWFEETTKSPFDGNGTTAGNYQTYLESLPDNQALDAIRTALSNWTTEEKIAFLNNADLGGGYNYGGCIRYS